jgi:hypothetical protein
VQGFSSFGDGTDAIDFNKATVPFEVCHNLIYGKI